MLTMQKNTMIRVLVIVVLGYFIAEKKISFQFQINGPGLSIVEWWNSFLDLHDAIKGTGGVPVTSLTHFSVAPTDSTWFRKDNHFEEAIIPAFWETKTSRKDDFTLQQTTSTHLQKTNVSQPAPAASSNALGNLVVLLNPAFIQRNKISPGLVEQKWKKLKNYVQRFAPVAQIEMQKFGIPASIKLAQALLESNAGDSKLAANHNNHFGIKCFSRNCARGHCTNFSDDTHKDFFKNYRSAWESFRAHSYLLQSDRYKALFKLAPTDYKNWAVTLKNAGYATDKKYAEKLIQIIEGLKLYEYDQL